MCVNRDGIQGPKTVNSNMLEGTSETVWLKGWFLYFKLPANILAPRTNRILPMTAVAIEDLTTSNKPSLRAKKEIINSVAFPKVPFKNPSILGPD